MDLVTPAAGIAFDSAIKVLEVTAQEIVDRINRPHEEKVDGDTVLKAANILQKRNSVGSVSGAGEQDPEFRNGPSEAKFVHAGKVTRVRSTQSTSDQGDTSGTESSVGSPTRIARRESEFTTDQHLKVAVLLGDLQKWINDTQAYGSGKGRDLSLGKGLVNNLYYLYSIESFLKDLDWPSQKMLSAKFSTQLVDWLKLLFDFRTASESEVEYNTVLPHWGDGEGMLAVLKWNLFSHFPNLHQKGYETFQEESRTPVIYCSDDAIAEKLVATAGISRSWISLIDSTKADWINELEQRIVTDSKENRTPTILILSTGRNVKNLEKACRMGAVYKLWVHLYGRNTFSYFVKRPETDQIANSFTIDLNKWMNSPPMPYLTVFKKPVVVGDDVNRLELSGLTSTTNDILSFTPWFCAEVYGQDKTKTLVEETCERGQFLLTMLKHYPDCMSIAPNWSTLTDGQVIVSALSFRYKPKSTKGIDETNDSGRHVGFEQPSAQYVDTLNSWLYHIMERDLKSCLPVEFVYVKDSGWNVLFDVLSTGKFKPEDEERIQRTFDTHMTVLQCTVRKKMEFGKHVRETPELEWIDYETQWAGLGAVRYIPKFYRASDKITAAAELSDGASKRSAAAKAAKQHSLLEKKSTINHVNAQIVEKLKSIDSAFSLGEDPDGDFCVQFGMVTNETEVAELVKLVIATGEEIEESEEFFHQMSELVKKGIEKATEELKRESDEALWEEGILRRVPVVGTFMNWWSPPMKESGVRGRALNLAQGKVESTENIYKYHMQVETVSPAASSVNILNKIGSNSSLRK